MKGMNYMTFSIICSHSILIASVIAFFRIKVVLKDFYPFILLLWLGLLNETISLAFLYNRQSNAVNSNIYVMVEFLLILYQFYRWNTSGLVKYLMVAVAGIAVWVTDNFVINSLSQNNSIFRVFYSLMILLCSAAQINKIEIFENGWFKGNTVYLICIIFIFLYGFKAWVESFNMIHLGLSGSFLSKLWLSLNIVNLITNLLLALAVLWIPTKQRFFIH